MSFTPVASTRRKAGWWFYGPLLWGLVFLVLGVALAAGGSGGGSAGGALLGTGGVFVVMGLGGLGFAFYVRRDIRSDLGPPPPAGTRSAAAEDALRSQGSPGHATITTFSYVTGTTANGSTLVHLTLDVFTVAGGHSTAQPTVRVPLPLASNLAVGATVPVTVSAIDPNDVLVDWAGYAASGA